MVFGHEQEFRPEHRREQEREHRREHRPEQGNEQEHEHKHVHVECPVVTDEDINITVPISVQAHADVEDLILKCMGHHVSKESHRRTHHVRKIKIRQTIQLCVPINFIAEAEVGEEDVDFGPRS